MTIHLHRNLLQLALVTFLAFVQTTHGFFMSMGPQANTNIKPYAVNVKFGVKPERRNDFLNLIQENQRLTLDTEPDSLQYTVGEDINDSNTFYIHEQFTSLEGFEAHRDTDHAKTWAKFKDTDPFSDGLAFDFFYGSKDEEHIQPTPIRSAFCVHVELCIDPNRLEEFMKVIENNAKCSNDETIEPLCLQYFYGESTEVKHKFIFHEEYCGSDGGKEGFVAHQNTEHFRLWEEFASTDPFTEEPVVNFFRTLK